VTETTDSMAAQEPRRLTRTRDGRWAGGVCSGLGSYFDVSPLVYRIAFLALTLAGGVGFLLYVAAWLVIPEQGARESIAEEALRQHRDEPWFLLGVGLVGLGALLAVSHARIWPAAGSLWLAAVVAGGALIWWRREERRRRAGRQAPVDAGATPGADASPAAAVEPRAPRRSLFLPAFGGMIAVAGTLAALDAIDVVTVDWTVALAVGAAVLGVIVATGAVLGRGVQALTLVALALLAAAAVGLALRIPLSAGIGQRVDHPVTAAGLQPTYELGVGRLTVDLRDVPLPAADTHVTARVGVGALTVILPATVAMDVHEHAGVGTVSGFGQRHNGTGADQRIVLSGTGNSRIDLSAWVGMGSVQVIRE
jgi:phage shock protein PspC (stress-responsive transcriptional regulator)